MSDAPENDLAEGSEIRQSTRGFNVIFLHSSVDDAGLDVYAFRLLAHLSRRASGGQSWSSLANMAKTCRMNIKTAQAAMSTLEVMGFIKRIHRPGFTSIVRITPQGDKPPKATKRTKPKQVKATDPRIHEFIDGWCAAYKETFGDDYVVQGGVDGAAVKRLLGGAKKTVPELLAVARVAWENKDRGRRWFNAKFACAIKTFASKFNEVLREVNEMGNTGPGRGLTNDGSEAGVAGLTTGGELPG